jgi:site-specific DNA recombinase
VNFCKAIEVLANGRIFSKVLTQNIKMVLGAACNLSAEEIDERLLELQNEMLELTELHAKAGADSTKYDQEYERLAKDIQQLRFQKQNLQGHNSERLLKRTVTTEMLEFLENQSFLILKYNDSLVRKYVENVRVFEDKVLVEFKSGVETEVAR